MFIFERLRTKSKDVDKVYIYYVIIQEKKNSLQFYTQDIPTLWGIANSENPAKALLDVYLSLMKTYKDVRRNKDYAMSVPARSTMFEIPLNEFRAEQHRRRLAGERCQLRLEP